MSMDPLVISFSILSYFALLLLIARFTGRKSDNDTFFLGNRNSPWYVVAFGMVGASLSGVTFISVPGWVGASQFSYMQLVFGYFIGYIIIAQVLLPVYYRLRLTSIYTYLGQRFGSSAYKTGASFFIISRLLGSSARLYLVAAVLQFALFDAWGVPFAATVALTIAFIWVYTFRGGIKTIIWTDTLQTLFMLASVGISIVYICSSLDMSFSSMLAQVWDSQYSKMFFFSDWADKKHFAKYVLSGALITIVMTGLDQDMMQKNLSCRSLPDAKKNMLWFSVILLAVNLVFLLLGALLFIYTDTMGIQRPDAADSLYPMIAMGGYLPAAAGTVFILGLVAAAYSSADSALTALTTSFTVDIVGISLKTEAQAKKLRILSHIGFSAAMLVCVLGIDLIGSKSIIDTIFVFASYTYGPLLGLYAFGLFTKLSIAGRYAPIVAILSPVLSFAISWAAKHYTGYAFGYELLLLNGALCFSGLYLIKIKEGAAAR
jgi:solute:Na+ symporter, SSS family